MSLFKNFAYSTVATAPSPASSGTTLTVQTGDGAKYPTVPFYAVDCPAGVLPTAANAEVMLTSVSGDVMTIVRSGSPRTIVVGDAFFHAATAEALIAMLPTESHPTTTGNITSLPLPVGGLGDLVTQMNNATLATIQGMKAGLYVGQRWLIKSIGAGQVDFAHHNGSATGAQVTCIATSAPTSLAAGVGTAEFVWDGTFWVMTAHEQGAWITPASPTWGVNVSGTFTPTATTTLRYLLRGRTLHVAFIVGGTNSNASNTVITLTSTGWGGFTSQSSVLAAILINDTGAGSQQGGFVQSGAASATLSFAKYNSATFTTGAGAVTLFGEIVFEVQ